VVVGVRCFVIVGALWIVFVGFHDDHLPKTDKFNPTFVTTRRAAGCPIPARDGPPIDRPVAARALGRPAPGRYARDPAERDVDRIPGMLWGGRFRGRDSSPAQRRSQPIPYPPPYMSVAVAGAGRGAWGGRRRMPASASGRRHLGGRRPGRWYGSGCIGRPAIAPARPGEVLSASSVSPASRGPRRGGPSPEARRPAAQALAR